MEFIELEKQNREDSIDDFEFLDPEGDLEIVLPISPASGATNKLTSGIEIMVSTLCTIAEEKGLNVSVSVTTMATTAIGAITGSLIGGGPGLAIGLVTAAVVAYRSSPNRNKSPKPEPKKFSIRQIFTQMTLQQKMELLKELLGCLKHSNVRTLVSEILKNEKIRNAALEILSGFLMRKLGISLVKAS